MTNSHKLRRFMLAALVVPIVTHSASGQPDRLPERLPINAAMHRGKQHVLTQLDLKETRVVDAMRLISEIAGLNIVATPDAAQKTVTLYLQNVMAIDAMETVAKLSGLWYRENPRTGTIRMMTTAEYQKDLVFHRDDVTRVFTLLHPNVTSAAQAIQDLYGNRVVLALSSLTDDDFGTQQSGFGTAGDNGQGNQGQNGTGSFSRSGAVSGGGQFSRAVGGGQQQMGGGRGNTDTNRRASEPLTPEQISQLERRNQNSQSEGGRRDDAVLREMSNTEPPIYITVNRQHNLVIVRTSDEDAMDEIAKLISAMDRPTPGVLLEMKILELTVDDNYRRIFDLKGADKSTPTSQDATSYLLGSLANNTLALGGEPLSSGTMLYQYMNDHITAQIQWYKEHNCLHTVASPLVLASHNKTARIFVGEERVMTTGVNTNVVTSATGTATTAIEPITEIRDIGVTLSIIPKINANRTVTLSITHESSTLKPGSATIPVAAQGGGVQTFNIDTVDTATLQGTVIAKDSLTVALGGMIRETKVSERRKVPLLGDIHALFTRKVEVSEKRELILLITPHVITTPMEGELKTQWRLNELSDHDYRHRIGNHSQMSVDAADLNGAANLNGATPTASGYIGDSELPRRSFAPILNQPTFRN